MNIVNARKLDTDTEELGIQCNVKDTVKKLKSRCVKLAQWASLVVITEGGPK